MSSVSLDTNILFYAFDPKDHAKHLIARRIVSIVSRRAFDVPLQAVYEFYQAATRKSLVTPTLAAEIVNDLRVGMVLHPISSADLTGAMQLHHEHGFQFYDCMILSTAMRIGCRTFFTEDLQHRRVINGVTILNPFLLQPLELDALLS